jgi:protein-S-isoprenylcysteine O-methyltransferase Ste14
MKDPLGKLPALLFVAALVLLAFALANQLRAPVSRASIGAAIVFGGYLLWMFLEARITFGEAGKGATGADRGSLALYGMGRLGLVVAAVMAPNAADVPGLCIVAGLALFAFGVTLRLAAIRELGSFYSHRVRIVAAQPVVQGGPYRWIRHPSYSGMLLAHAGLVTLFLDGWSVGLFIGLLLPAIIYRIHVEERTLYALRGYEDYGRSRRRLVPYVW